LSWKALSDEAKEEGLLLYTTGSNPSDVSKHLLAKYGVKVPPVTLGRRLRELAEQRVEEGTGTRISYVEHGDSEVTAQLIGEELPTVADVKRALGLGEEWEAFNVRTSSAQKPVSSVAKKLSWIEGVISGSIDQSPAQVQVMYRLEVSFRKVVAPASLQPLQLKVTVRGKAKGASGKVGNSVLILPDPQIGYFVEADGEMGELASYHDSLALQTALNFAAYLQPDAIVWVGDLLDLPDWQEKFPSSPNQWSQTQRSLEEAAYWLAKFRPLAESMVVLEGNHDERMPRAAKMRMPASWNLKAVNSKHPALSLPNLLDFDGLDVTYVNGYPNNEYWLNDNTKIIHGKVVRGNPGGTATALVNNTGANVVFGHIHRIELNTRTVHTRAGERYLQAMSPGCLCRTDYVVPGHSHGQNWQQGVGIINFVDDEPFMTPLRISANYRVVFDGRIFTPEGVE